MIANVYLLVTVCTSSIVASGSFTIQTHCIATAWELPGDSHIIIILTITITTLSCCNPKRLTLRSCDTVRKLSNQQPAPLLWQDLCPRWNYWWPQMSYYIGQYVKTCDLCLCIKVQQYPPVGELSPPPTPESHGDTISIDFIVKLPESHATMQL